MNRFLLAIFSILPAMLLAQDMPVSPSLLEMDYFSDTPRLKGNPIPALPYFSEMEGFSGIKYFVPLNQDIIFYATGTKVYCLNREVTTQIFDAGNKRPNLIEGLFAVQNHLILVTTANGFLDLDLASGKWQHLSTGNLLLTNNIHQAQAYQEAIYVFGDNTAYTFWDGKWSFFPDYPRFSRCVAEFSGHEIIGTFTEGLKKLNNGIWEQIPESGFSINQIGVSPDQSYLAAACFDGIRIYKKGFTDTRYLLKDKNILDMAILDNKVFCVSQAHGLYVYYFDSSHIDRFGSDDGIEAKYLKSVSVIGKTVYVLGFNGKVYSSDSIMPMAAPSHIQPSFRITRHDPDNSLKPAISQVSEKEIIANDLFTVPDAPIVYVGEDRNTGGKFSLPYGKGFGLICAVSPPLDMPVNLQLRAQGYSISGRIEKSDKPGDSLRYWASRIPADVPRDCFIRIPDQPEDYDIASCWDDHGEAYPTDYDGPNILVEVSLPPADHEVALFFNAGARDMKIECLSEDLKEVLCKARVQNSDNGKFVRFLVDGAKLPKVIFRIKRGNNHNTNISGIFTAPLDVDPGTAIPLVHDEVLNQLKSQFAWLKSDRQRQFYLKREVLADMALYKHIFRDNDPIYQHFGTAYMAAVARNWSLHLTALEKGIHATLGLSDLTFDSEKNIFYGSLQRLLVILKQQDIPQAFKAGINKTFFELAIAKYKKDGFVNNHALLADKWFYATPEMVICLNREMDRIDSAANRKITKNAIFDYFLAMSYYKTGQTDNFLKNADIFITTYPDFSEVEDLKNKMLQAKSRTP